MSEGELKLFGETSQFKKLFICKGFHKVHVHYFHSKFIKGVETSLRSIQLKQLDSTRDLEVKLTGLEFEEALGNRDISIENERKLLDAFRPLLREWREVGKERGGGF